MEGQSPAVKARLEPGDRLRRDLINTRNRQILLPGGTTLTPHFIRKIHDMGLLEEALRCVVEDFDARRHAARDQERGLPFEYALYVEGKETVRVLLDLATQPQAAPITRDAAWERASLYVGHLLDKLETVELGDFPDLRIYDLYLHSHPLNTATLSAIVGKALEMGRQQIHDLALAALFADLGKARLPPVLLYKPDKLSEAELEWVRQHASLSAEVAEQFRWAQGIVRYVAGTHHERWDGSGYPRGLSGHAIAEEASIVGLVDAYDAMISDVPYRKRMEPAIAYRVVTTGNHFDPVVVEAFRRRVTPYPRGTSVKLSNGQEACVMRASQANPYRPVVELEGREVDLAADAALRITAHLIPRRFQRKVVRMPAVVASETGRELAGTAMDLSLGGICLEAAAAPPMGEQLVVRLEPPDGQGTLHLQGHLLWVRHGEGGKSVFALSAIPASDSDRERLMNVLLDIAGVPT